MESYQETKGEHIQNADLDRKYSMNFIHQTPKRIHRSAEYIRKKEKETKISVPHLVPQPRFLPGLKKREKKSPSPFPSKPVPNIFKER